MKRNMYIIIPIVLVVLAILGWYVKRSQSSSKQQVVIPDCLLKLGFDKCLNKQITNSGIARDTKGGAVVLQKEDYLIYLKNVDTWPKNMVGKMVTVTGLLKKEQYLPVATADSNGVVSQGVIPGDGQWVLEDAKFELSPLVSSVDPKLVSQSIKFKVDPLMYVVFSADKKYDFFASGIKSWWTPTQSDVESAESSIPNCLKQDYPNIFVKLDGYNRQYVGFVDQSGHKQMWINFFTFNEGNSVMDGWRENVVGTADGGDYYFNMVFDLDNNQCKNIQVNGVA